MKLSTYKTQLPILFKANVTPLLWGAHGIGKTSLYEQFAASGGHRVFNLRLGNMEIGDIIGLPDTSDGTTRFNPPDWMVDMMRWAESNPDKWAIIHMDEINHIRKDMQGVVFQMALDYRVHTHVFPPNVRIAASANPPTKDYPGVFDFRNQALLDRFCHIALTPAVDEWVTWATASGVDADWVAFAQATPAALFPVGEYFDVVALAKPSARSLQKVSSLYAAGADRETLYGMIGMEATENFYAFKKKRDEDRIPVADILSAYKSKVDKRLKKWVDDAEYARINSLCDELEVTMKALTEPVSDKAASNIAEFIMALPIDRGYATALSLSRITPGTAIPLDNCKKLHEYFKALITEGKVVIK
jgi:hypothetical protein